jgi:hypothetical protein
MTPAFFGHAFKGSQSQMHFAWIPGKPPQLLLSFFSEEAMPGNIILSQSDVMTILLNMRRREESVILSDSMVRMIVTPKPDPKASDTCGMQIRLMSEHREFHRMDLSPQQSDDIYMLLQFGLDPNHIQALRSF